MSYEPISYTKEDFGAWIANMSTSHLYKRLCNGYNDRYIPRDMDFHTWVVEQALNHKSGLHLTANEYLTRIDA